MLKHMDFNKKIFRFSIFNIVLVAVVAIIWLGPTAQSARSTAEHVSFLENRYTILTRAALAYESNLLEIEALNQANRLLTYYRLTQTISDITLLTNTYNLQKINFIVGEPVGFDTYAFERLMERRVRMESVGTVDDTVKFLQQLQNIPVTVTEMVLDIDVSENIWLNIEMLILFGD